MVLISAAETLKSKETESVEVYKDEFLGKDQKFWTRTLEMDMCQSLNFAMHETGVLKL